MVLGTGPKISGLLEKCNATEETYPGTESVNAEHEISPVYPQEALLLICFGVFIKKKMKLLL